MSVSSSRPPAAEGLTSPGPAEDGVGAEDRAEGVSGGSTPRDSQAVATAQPLVEEMERSPGDMSGSTETRIIGWDESLFRSTLHEGLRFERVVRDAKGNVLRVEHDSYTLSRRWVRDVDEAKGSDGVSGD